MANRISSISIYFLRSKLSKKDTMSASSIQLTSPRRRRRSSDTQGQQADRKDPGTKPSSHVVLTMPYIANPRRR